MRPKNPEESDKPLERSRLHVLAAILTGGSVISLGLTTAVLRVLSQDDRSKLVLKVSLKQYIESLKSEVRTPLIIERGQWWLTEVKEIIHAALHPSDTADSDELDLRSLVLAGLPSYTGDYQYALNTPSGDVRNHVLRLSEHGTIGKDENWQTAVIGHAKEKIANPAKLATISIDSLPTLVTPDLVATLKSSRQFVPIKHLSSARLNHVEHSILDVFVNGWFPDLPPVITFLATDISLPRGEIKEQIYAIQNNLASSITGVQSSIDVLSYVYLAKTALALPIAAGQSYIATKLQGNEKPVVNRRRFIQVMTGAVIVGGHLAMGQQSGSIAVDVNKIRKEIDSLAWIFNLPFQVADRAPANFIGRVNGFLATAEDQIPEIGYFLFVRELLTAYKEMKILQTGSYTSEMQPDSLSLWGSVHDTKIGLYAVSQSELLRYIGEAISRFPTLFRTCFGPAAIDQQYETNYTYSGPHELFTASAFRAEAQGPSREWKISGVEVWTFDELRDLVEGALR